MREPTKAKTAKISPAPHGPASARSGCPTAAPTAPPARRHPSRPSPTLDAGRSRWSSPAMPVAASPPPAPRRPSSPSRWRSRATPKAARASGTATAPSPTRDPARNSRAPPAAPATPSQMPSPPTPASRISPTPVIWRRWARSRPIGRGAPVAGRALAAAGRAAAGLTAARVGFAGARRLVREATVTTVTAATPVALDLVRRLAALDLHDHRYDGRAAPGAGGDELLEPAAGVAPQRLEVERLLVDGLPQRLADGLLGLLQQLFGLGGVDPALRHDLGAGHDLAGVAVDGDDHDDDPFSGQLTTVAQHAPADVADHPVHIEVAGGSEAPLHVDALVAEDE